ncbi:MAG: hypothetical protein ACTHL8_23285 [Burkholderiaceae bacterium]
MDSDELDDETKASILRRHQDLLARMDDAKASSNDAHVDAWRDLALSGSLLLRVAEARTGDERVEAVRKLLRLAAAELASNRPLPVPLRLWLSSALFEAARSPRNANQALGLTPGSGRSPNTIRRMHNVAQIHAIRHWFDFGLTAAAAAALPFALRANGQHGTGEDASVLVKEFNAIAAHWAIEGPFIVDDRGDAVGDQKATLDDLRSGRHVHVEFAHRRFPRNWYSIRVSAEVAGKP